MYSHTIRKTFRTAAAVDRMREDPKMWYARRRGALFAKGIAEGIAKLFAESSANSGSACGP